MKTQSLYLGLGSNDARKEEWIDRAIELISSYLEMQPTAVSSRIATPAWGFDGPDFLNCVLRYDIPDAGQNPALHAHAMLAAFQEIERRLGRTQKTTKDAAGRPVYHDRTIDIDILLYGRLQLSSDVLTLPHPLMQERDFVRIPLAEIISDELASWWTSLR